MRAVRVVATVLHERRTDGRGVIANNYCETLQASQTIMIEDIQNCSITGNTFAGKGSTEAHVSGNTLSPGINYEVGIDQTSMEGYDGPEPGGAP